MYSFRLTEEIARWAFEIICRKNNNWYIAFTNPTAGPWKTIKATNKNNQEAEIYRFELEETRPDILLINDKLKSIIIIEAKDSIQKLLVDSQISKSVEVVADLTDILQNINNTEFWNERKSYKIITGLLWGAEKPLPAHEEYNELFEKYTEESMKFDNIFTDFLIGIETLRESDKLSCRVKGYLNETSQKSFFNEILTSFDLPTF